MKTLNDLGYELSEKDGKPYHCGSLYLQGTGITSLPDNLTVGGLSTCKAQALQIQTMLIRMLQKCTFGEKRNTLKSMGYFLK